MPHILIVDDNQTFLYAARELIMRERHGFLVDTAADAEQAVLAIHRHTYDVVVSDIRLPALQGLELLAECRRIRPDTPVVLITGYGDRELEEEAARCGAYAFLHKPLAADTFCAVVDRAVWQARVRRNSEHGSGVDNPYSEAAEHIRRKSRTLVHELSHAVTHDDKDMFVAWAEEEAERIVTTFLDYEGSDDLLRLKDLISHALSAAYETGKRRQAALSVGPTRRKNQIHPDTGI